MAYTRKRGISKRKRNFTRKRRTVRGKTNPKPSANFSKKVLKVVSRAAETKCCAPLIQRGNEIRTLLTDNTTQCIPLVPVIAQGVGQGDRLGNEVTTKNVMLYIQTHVYQITNASNSDPPKFVDYYLYKFKKSNNQTGVDLRKFLQYGNTSTDYDGANLPESGGLNLNNDLFVLKKHIRRQLWNPNSANTYALANRNVQNGNSMKLNITKYYKKKLQFDDDISNSVTNDNLYLSVVYTNNDGQQYASNLAVGDFDATMIYKYDDM